MSEAVTYTLLVLALITDTVAFALQGRWVLFAIFLLLVSFFSVVPVQAWLKWSRR